MTKKVLLLLPEHVDEKKRIKFLSKVTNELNCEGLLVKLVSSSAEQDEILSDLGASFFNINSFVPTEGYDKDQKLKTEVENIEEEFRVNTKRMILPEMIQRERDWSEKDSYLRRFVNYIRGFENLIETFEPQAIFAGIGPFLLIRSASLVAKTNHIDRYFFSSLHIGQRKLLFFDNDMLTAGSVVGMPETSKESEREEVKELVKEMLKSKAMPDYVNPLSLKEEIRSHTFTFLERFNKLFLNPLNSMVTGLNMIYDSIERLAKANLNKLKYTQPSDSEKYLFFPLHHLWDTQILLRGEPYCSQEFLVEHIMRNLPYGYKLYVKEHPNAVGQYPDSALRRVAKMDEVKLLPPNINPHKLIEGASVVITINSTTGLEALMHNCPVLTFGRPFYSTCSSVIKVEDLFNTSEKIRRAISYKVDSSANLEYLTRLYKAGYDADYFSIKNQLKDQPQELALAMKDVLDKHSKDN